MSDQIGDLPTACFDELDDTAGAPACHERTRLNEGDGRWRFKYLRCTEDGLLQAAIPLYTSRAKTWADPAYDPATWPTPETGSQDPLTPRTSLIVGGRNGLRSSLHARPSFRESPHFRLALREIASVAAEEGRGLVFPYIYAETKDALSRASDGRIAWTLLGKEAVLRDVSSPNWRSSIGAHARNSLNRDSALIVESGLTGAVRTWDEVEDKACELIADHNTMKGRPDHPEFVRMRYRDWLRCSQVECVVFTAETPAAGGVMVGVVWNGDLEILEVGLTGEPGPERLAVYLDLLFHQPLRLAWDRGLRDIRLGAEAGTPKASRGAVFQEQFGGVLGVAETRALADERKSGP